MVDEAHQQAREEAEAEAVEADKAETKRNEQRVDMVAVLSEWLQFKDFGIVTIIWGDDPI